MKKALTFIACGFLLACSSGDPLRDQGKSAEPTSATQQSEAEPGNPSPAVEPQRTSSPLGTFDFRNHTYPVPRGWQDTDGEDVKLVQGSRPLDAEEGRVGFKFIEVRFLDATGDGADEAVVVLQIDTAGASIPQVVYLYGWKEGAPELLWSFRTGDRADGGLKDIYADGGDLVVELFGKDRFVLGSVETQRITGDEDDLCCPTAFTRSRYKLNGGKNFRITGKRLTYSLSSPADPPVENMGELNSKGRK